MVIPGQTGTGNISTHLTCSPLPVGSSAPYASGPPSPAPPSCCREASPGSPSAPRPGSTSVTAPPGGHRTRRGQKVGYHGVIHTRGPGVVRPFEGILVCFVEPKAHRHGGFFASRENTIPNTQLQLHGLQIRNTILHSTRDSAVHTVPQRHGSSRFTRYIFNKLSQSHITASYSRPRGPANR